MNQRLLLGCLLVLPAGALTVDNLTPGETLRYPVALLVGTTQAAVPFVEARVGGGEARLGRVTQGAYRVLVPLGPGDNAVSLVAGDERLGLRLTYRPMTNPHLVRVIYLVGQEGETTYPSPTPDAPQDMVGRLRTAARLMQTFCAEAMAQRGHGRLTFRLEEDQAGEVLVRTVPYPEPADTLRRRDPGEQWQRTNQFLGQRFADGRSKFLCLNGFVGYDRDNRRMLGHTALGGGNLAVFSANSLYAWPASLADVDRAFLDATPPDTAFVADDTAFRGTNWAQAATGIGAWLHEFGHTLGLPHSRDGRCIMARGFDGFNRSFVTLEAPRAGQTEPRVPGPEETAVWDARFATRLALHPWLRPDAPPTSDQPAPSIRLDWATNTLRVTAPAGIGVLQGTGPEERVAALPGDGSGETTASITRDDLRRLAEAPQGAGLLVIDQVGRAVHFDEGSARNPAWFIRAWQLDATPTDWTGVPSPPAVDVAGVIERLRGRTVEEVHPADGSGQYSFDGAARWGGGNRLGYALRTITTETARTLVLLAGGDDGVRIWLNGELVLDASGVKVVPVDGAKAAITLRAGENTLLVESQQGPGDWCCSVRLTEPDGRPLALDAAGRLAPVP